MPGLAITLLAGCLDALLARACALCGGAVLGPPLDDALCPPCTAGLGVPHAIVPPPPIAAGAALGRYEGPLRAAIHMLKYGRRGELAPSLGRRLAAALPEAIGAAPDARAPEAVIPVPLHPHRLAERGFNQSALLARQVARQLGAPLLARALVRVRDTAPQASLGGAARRGGVREAFLVPDGRQGAAVVGRRCLLVDDVVTTGATAAACAKALVEAGAARVRLLALARA